MGSVLQRKINWKHQVKEDTNSDAVGENVATAKKRSVNKTKCLRLKKEEIRRLKSEWVEDKIPKKKITPLKRKTPNPVFVHENSKFSYREYKDKLLREFGFT